MKTMPLKQAQAHIYAAAQGKKDVIVTLLTWKQDRSIEVEHARGVLILRENGYQKSESVFAQARDMKHALKEAFAREFPRSNRIYVNERTP